MVAFSCSKEKTDAPKANQNVLKSIVYCGSTTDYPFIAGQFTNVGTVNIGNDATNYYISITTTAGNEMLETHLWYGCAPPTERGAPGQYSVIHENLGGVLTDTYIVPRADIVCENNDCGATVYFKVHAKLVTDETAMGGTIVTSQDASGSWYGSIAYTIQCCTPPPDVYTCTNETAFGGTIKGAGKAWWFIFDTQTTSSATIWAGQTMNAGSVTYNALAGTFTISLADGWSLVDVVNGLPYTEPVKAQGYAVYPTSRPAAGLFTTYKGTSLTFAGNGSRYYDIQLDVKHCVLVKTP